MTNKGQVNTTHITKDLRTDHTHIFVDFEGRWSNKSLH